MSENTVHAKDLHGLEVVGPHGWKIGRVENILVDKTTWKVTQMEVKLEKEVADRLNMKRFLRSTLLQIPVDRITGVGNVISITYSQEDVDRLMTTQGS
jgi:sporulation protein YlmC with PRC-barrel domain